MNTKGKLKESKVFTCWILLLLWTRLRAWGCHWYKVWTFLLTRPGHGEAPRGAVSEKILLQPCDWSVDSKLWWKRAERLKRYIRMTLWKCITFFHTSLSRLSKAPLLQCYQNTSRGDFDLWAFPMCPSISQWFCWTHNSSLFSPSFLPRSLSLCVTSRWHSYSNTEGRDAPSGSPLREGGEQKYVVISFISKYFTFPLKMNVLCQVTFKCKDVHELHLLEKKKSVIFLHFMWKQQEVSKS